MRCLVLTLLPLALIHANVLRGEELHVSVADPEQGIVQLRLSRMLTLDDGRLATVLADVDVTALFRPGPLVWTFEPASAHIAAGDHMLRIYQVSLRGEWVEIGSYPIRVETPVSPEPVEAPPAAGTNPEPSRTLVQPSLSLTFKSQHWHRFDPADTAPARPSFDDLTVQGTLHTQIQHNGVAVNTDWSLAGATYDAETLRYSERGADAPHLDLASYKTSLEWKGRTIELGHIQAGTSRHLIDNFASRGIRFALPLGRRADFALAQVNGTQIVGWGNFFGLNRFQHQLGSATLGLELLPRPGGLRLELSALSGSLLPLTGFTQGALTDAERSTGGSVRVRASDPSQRLRIDTAFTRSAFRNPNDPALNAFEVTGVSIDTAAVRRETRGAYYVDASADLIRDAFAQSARPLTITLNVRRERVDPQFRSVGAAPQADRMHNQVEGTLVAGPITAGTSFSRSHDNLFAIVSLMRTSTRQAVANLVLPLTALWNIPPRRAALLPQLTYAFLDLHQRGAGNPLGFDSLSQVPDQRNGNHNFLLEWNIGGWRAGYRFNRSVQDNRQPGRELADLTNTVNSASLAWTLRTLTSSFEAGLEDVFAREFNQTNRTIRVAANNMWTIRQGVSMMVNLSLTRLSQFGTISRTRALEGDSQLTWDLSSDKGSRRRARPQLFLRYANRYQSIFDGLFFVDALTRVQTLQAGLTFSFE